jgi:hypothetical protein
MTVRRRSFLFRVSLRRAKGLIVLALLSGTALAQEASMARLDDRLLDSDVATSSPANPSPANTGPIGSSAMIAAPMAAAALPEAPSPHKFWDNENRVLFSAVAALSAADFAVTRSILQDGGKELNPVTRVFSGSTAGLAVNFAGQTAGIIGLSYLFHKTGHHQLERITPMLNIGASSFAVVYDLNHR